ncbi:hypothetical protein [Epilithonimonas pallida]|uniref:hypothetical protein n=1 Tax=Epilithonimonas pallida TaxID=373671 RepID=UPI0024B66B19|nr:hypothetical protein [Epilithonimonas pallida]
MATIAPKNIFFICLNFSFKIIFLTFYKRYAIQEKAFVKQSEICGFENLIRNKIFKNKIISSLK